MQSRTSGPKQSWPSWRSVYSTSEDNLRYWATSLSCADCAARLRDLVAIADGLLLLAPEVDPPAGFDQRVLERAKVGSLCW